MEVSEVLSLFWDNRNTHVVFFAICYGFPLLLVGAAVAHLVSTKDARQMALIKAERRVRVDHMRQVLRTERLLKMHELETLKWVREAQA